MKSLLVAVSIIAVFTADDRDFRIEPGAQVATPEEGNLPNEEDLFFSGYQEQDFNYIEQQATTTDEAQIFPNGADGEDEFKSSDLPMEEYLVTGGHQDQDFTLTNKQQEKLQHKRTVKKSVCKIKTTCTVLGGNCVTNATLCSGRLLSKGCKGRKCRCCVPGTLEKKIQSLENVISSQNKKINSLANILTYSNRNLNIKINSLKTNLTNSDKNQDLKMNSMHTNLTNSDVNIHMKMNSLQTNLTTSDKNLNMKMNSLQTNLTNSNKNLNVNMDLLQTNLSNLNKNLNMKLNSLQINLTNSDKNLNMKINSLETNLTHLNDNLNMKMNSLETNLTNLNNNLKMKMNSLETNLTNANNDLKMEIDDFKNNITKSVASMQIRRSCPTSCFYYAPSNQCFKVYNDTKYTWAGAVTKCRGAGLVLAKPKDPTSLYRYLRDNYGSSFRPWVDAKTDGSQFVWQRDGEKISNNDPLWHSGQPSSDKLTIDTCLVLRFTTRPYYPWSYCTDADNHALCEDII